MTVHLHHLTGCAPRPLAHYLKAIGVLRLLAEQADAEARGFWRDEHFCLVTKLDRQQLEAFFLDHYEPTPAFNPWGARSGFYAAGSEKAARAALDVLLARPEARFARFRDAAVINRSAIQASGGKKPDDDETKERLLSSLRRQLRGAGMDWLDAVMVFVDGRFRAPALLGTGGNEGSGGYGSAFLQALVESLLEDRSTSARWLVHTLFTFEGTGAVPAHAWSGSFGQFLPSGQGSSWDFVLAMEGTVAFRSGVAQVSRESNAPRYLASPFYLPHHAAGASADAPLDEFAVNKGRPNPGRGEQWFPLWEQPSTYPEFSMMLGEGRCTVGRRPAGTPLEAARAIARLGVARGLTAFERCGYLQRNNLATHFAVPLGAMKVFERPHARLLDELEVWMRRLHRAARDTHAPARIVSAERQVADAAFGAADHDSVNDWQALLEAVANVEALQASGTAFGVGPCPPLSTGWLEAAADDSPEWRLAVALGSAAAEYRKGRPVDSVRVHWLPLDGTRYATTGEQAQKRLLKDPRVVATGRDPLADLIAVVERRATEATAGARRDLPLVAPRGLGARASDIAAFLDGHVDLERMVSLARGLMAVRWREVPRQTPFVDRLELSAAWQAIRLCGLPYLVSDRRIPWEPSVVRRLASGDASSAVTLALQRLRASGLRPPLVAATTDPETARRWAAALVFPIDPAVANAMAKRFSNPGTPETP